MSLSVESSKKRVRRPNKTFSLDAPPDDVATYHLCEKHELYSLHNCSRCVVEKREATMLARHGVKSALHSKGIMEKKNATSLERYQTIHASQTEEVKQKTIQTNKERYGVEHSLQSKEIRQKGATTMMEKYGVEHATQNKEVLARRVETNISRFGVEAPLQSKEILEKRKKTNMERYQTEEVLQNKGIQQQIHNTMMERYHVGNPLKNKEILARKDATCLARYGNSVIMHVPELFEKKTINSFARKPLILPSGAVMYYQGYEDVAIKALLEDYKEDDIENDVKKMPECKYTWDGKLHRYYPDIYLPKERKIIEVKSDYTYLLQRALNQAKRESVVQQGYSFEFWICDKKAVLYKTAGWERDEDVPWYKLKRISRMVAVDADADDDVDAVDADDIEKNE